MNNNKQVAYLDIAEKALLLSEELMKFVSVLCAFSSHEYEMLQEMKQNRQQEIESDSIPF